MTDAQPEWKSNCCHANLIAVGNVTKHYECCKCCNPCNPCILVKLKETDWPPRLPMLSDYPACEHCGCYDELQAKYEKLLEFVKYIRRINCHWCAPLANELLKELGEDVK